MDSLIFQDVGAELVPIYGMALGNTIPTDMDYSNIYGGLQINLPINKSFDSLKIEIQAFNDINIIWLSKIYKDYEGQLWTKFISNDERTKFHCLLCDKVLCHFYSLRNHLNLHLEIYPFKCCACEKKYTNRSSLWKHRVTKHPYHLTSTANAGY